MIRAPNNENKSKHINKEETNGKSENNYSGNMEHNNECVRASKFRNQEIDSYKGIKGIAKKICMWLLVGVGVIVDQLLSYSADVVGITLPFTFLVACIVAIWLVCNEIISILENINDIGVTLPPFLKPIVSNLKSQVEKKAELESIKDENESEE